MVGRDVRFDGRVPVIQVTVPSATVPASFSMAVAKRRHQDGRALTSGTSSGAKALVVTRSPVTLTVSPCSRGISAARYSFM